MNSNLRSPMLNHYPQKSDFPVPMEFEPSNTYPVAPLRTWLPLPVFDLHHSVGVATTEFQAPVSQSFLGMQNMEMDMESLETADLFGLELPPMNNALLLMQQSYHTESQGLEITVRRINELSRNSLATEDLPDFNNDAYAIQDVNPDLRGSVMQPASWCPELSSLLPYMGDGHGVETQSLGCPSLISPTKSAEPAGQSGPSKPSPSGGMGRARTAKRKQRSVQKGAATKKAAQRAAHIFSERKRRRRLVQHFSTIRSMLPLPCVKSEKSTVVLEMINYLKSLQRKLHELTKKKEELIARKSQSARRCTEDGNIRPRKSDAHGLQIIDQTADTSALTTITALPLPGQSESSLASYVGMNVAINACGVNVFITMICQNGGLSLFRRILPIVFDHNLDIQVADVSKTGDTTFYYLHCQAIGNAEVSKNTLHSALLRLLNTWSSGEASVDTNVVQ